MAFIGIRVPAETGRIIETIEVPGERKRASEYHTTIIYLGKNLPIETIAQTMIAAYNVASKTSPFICGVKEVSSFPRNPDDGIPVILPVLSQGLHNLRNALIQELTSMGIPFSNKYPDFKPHVSVSFIKDDSTESFQKPMDGPLTWTVSELVIWGGNKNDEMVSVSLPFVLSPLQNLARKIVQ